MAKFLNNSGTSYILEQLIEKAHKRVVLISPYLKFNKRIKELIEDRSKQGITFEVVYGKTELNESEKIWLNTIEGLNLYFSEDLHAKCYLNEGHCIITSMNLYEFSQVNNAEMGVLLTKKSDKIAFAEASEAAERIIRVSKPETVMTPTIVAEQEVEYKAEKKGQPKKPQKRSTKKEKPKYEKVPTSAIAKKHGVATAKLLKSFKAAGYIYDDNGMDKLTEKGQEIGGEFRKGYSGYYFIWPEALELNLSLSDEV